MPGFVSSAFFITILVSSSSVCKTQKAVNILNILDQHMSMMAICDLLEWIWTYFYNLTFESFGLLMFLYLLVFVKLGYTRDNKKFTKTLYIHFYVCTVCMYVTVIKSNSYKEKYIVLQSCFLLQFYLWWFG